MGKKAAAKGKKVAAAPLGGQGVQKSGKKNTLFESKKRNFQIGGDIKPKMNLTRFVKWPQYIRLQRQKRILLQRLKVPPSIAQFQATIDKNQFVQLARLMKKIQPETRAQKKERLAGLAKNQAGGKDSNNSCPPTLKYGINHVCDLVENNKAKMVVIAHDVDPVEVVCWLPALCKKKNVPYCIVKGKSRLGKMVNMKTATCVAVTTVPKEAQNELNTLCDNFKAQYNDNVSMQRRWGGGIMGVKSQHVTRRREMLLEKEKAKKTGLLK